MFNLRSRSRRWKRRAIICRPSGTWLPLWLTYAGLTLRHRSGRAGANSWRRSATGVGVLDRRNSLGIVGPKNFTPTRGLACRRGGWR
jgi:hypothetical protein